MDLTELDKTVCSKSVQPTMATKKALMVAFPCARGRAFVCKNIGDYVQSIAAKQYIDHIDEYIEQEEANSYFPDDKIPARMIMNGWFQWRAENWPPSEYIKPLLISMHFSPLRQEKLLTPEGIEFLKKNGPVGCRDLYTKSLLDSVGIPAYFSSCLTLTMGKKDKVSKDERKGVYFVDPYFEISPLYTEKNGKRHFILKNAISSLRHFLKHPFNISKLAKNPFFEIYSPTGFLDRDKYAFKKYHKATAFYSTYSKLCDADLMLGAEYITHWVDVDMSNDDNDVLLEMAENLVKKYASANLVITSRIHCGLPSLGLDTSVVFISNEEITSEKGTFNTPGRLGGLIDLFRVYTLSNNEFTTDDPVFQSLRTIGINTTFDNKPDWKKYASELDKKCSEFMDEPVRGGYRPLGNNPLCMRHLLERRKVA